VNVYAFYGNLDVFRQIDSSSATWTSPRDFTPTSDYTVYVRVTISNNDSNAGTFGIIFTESTPGIAVNRPPTGVIPATNFSPTPLTANVWSNGEFDGSKDEIWYSIPIVNNQNAFVWLNDSYEGDKTKTLDVMISAWRIDDSVQFTNIDSAWTTHAPRILILNNTTVYIKVTPKNPGETGTFGISYSSSFNTSTMRPE